MMGEPARQFATDAFLCGEEVHLYTANAASFEDRRESFTHLLNDDEIARYNRFLVDHSKLEFLIGRAMLRILLSGYTGLAPGQIEFRFAQNGKPEIANEIEGKPEFNLSHTRGLVALGVCLKYPLGVDVEFIERDRAEDGIARRYFSGYEVEWLNQYFGEDYRRNFYRLWTLKESYIKARGTGLSLPLHDFYMAFDGSESGEAKIGFVPGFGDDPARWQFRYWNLSAGHAMAVGIERGVRSDLHCRIIDAEHLLRMPFARGIA
ncbi:4'-phosphopantetheinyl transferase superfamily protein [Candidatus Sumerlaeota bacterium]|nr:4'-phosphopantetheinyl transferase superfamily protein [Candidatus Sumerlaeota bacterium]